jgi:hypothetical protein
MSHVRELLLCYTSKKVTNKLHKLTNYKSNYTSTIYIKVNTSLCMGNANQWEEQYCHQASPRCVDRLLGGSAANWHHPPSPHVGHRKNLPISEGSSKTRSTSVALRGSSGVSTIHITNHFTRVPHNLLCVLRRRPPPSRLGGGCWYLLTHTENFASTRIPLYLLPGSVP